MPFTPRPAYPVAIWEEPPLTASAFSVGLYTAYLLTDDTVRLYAPGDVVPGGATVLTVRDAGTGYEEIVSGAVAGRRLLVRPDGFVFLN